MGIFRNLMLTFRDGSWGQRALMLALAILAVFAVSWFVRTMVIPFMVQVYCWVVQVVVLYGTLTLFVTLFSPSTGKKMFVLFWRIIERLLLDPLLYLLGQKDKK